MASLAEMIRQKTNFKPGDSMIGSAIMHPQQVLKNLKSSDKTGIKPYRRLTGEAQARATQDRLDMDMAQRRESYPLANDMLSDIRLGQLINRYNK